MGLYRNRSNSSLYGSYNTPKALYDGEKLLSRNPNNISLWNLSICDDSVNDIKHLHNGGVFDLVDIGGPLDLRSVKCDFPIATTFTATGPPIGLNYRTEGPVIAWPLHAPQSRPTSTQLSAEANADSVLTRWGLGGEAIRNCKPGSPQASFGVFLSELFRDGIPSLLSNLLVKPRAEFFRSLGGDYLNVEFGWKPFVADLRKTAYALNHQADILEDLRRNSGKAMRRQYYFPGSRQELVLGELSNSLPWPAPYGVNMAGVRRDVKVTTKKTWFSGEFRYYYPPFEAGPVSKLRHWSRSIMGLDLTPETLWNASPWTWLLDWFVSIGPVMANISAISEDNLTMRYGYLMQEAITEYTITHTGLSAKWGYIPPVVRGQVTYSHKTRIGASPFGFGLTWDSLSPRQIAILAAIGVTRHSPSQSTAR